MSKKSKEDKIIEEGEGLDQAKTASSESTTTEPAVSDEGAAQEAVDAEQELTVEEQLAIAQQTADEKHNDWMRALADLQNASRRFETNLQNARTNTTSDVISELLPIIDDLTLAIANVPDEVVATDWYGGFSLIPKKLSTALEKLNVHKIESVGAEFDPEKHNAIMREESDEYESNFVIREYQPGFRLGDRIIRPAVVAVAE